MTEQEIEIIKLRRRVVILETALREIGDIPCGRVKDFIYEVFHGDPLNALAKRHDEKQQLFQMESDLSEHRRQRARKHLHRRVKEVAEAIER